MNATPEIIGLLAATIIFLIGMKLRERRILASQRVRRMHELLAEDIDGNFGIADTTLLITNDPSDLTPL